jgi:hypothetical protein
MHGNGTLTLFDGNENNIQHAVEFKFGGMDNMSGSPPWMPSLKSKETLYTGQVWRSDKGALEDGVYELHTADGVKCLVQNRGNTWVVQY